MEKKATPQRSFPLLTAYHPGHSAFSSLFQYIISPMPDVSAISGSKKSFSSDSKDWKMPTMHLKGTYDSVYEAFFDICRIHAIVATERKSVSHRDVYSTHW